MLAQLEIQKNLPWGDCPLGLVRSGGHLLGLQDQVVNYLIRRTR